MTVNRKAEEKAIRALDKAWSDAATRKDLRKVVAFYATDGSLVWPDTPPIHGKAAILMAWKSTMASIPGLVLKFSPERIHVSDAGDLASDYGVVFMQQKGEAGIEKITAKYLVVWKKQKGAWKVLYDSWNYNVAPHR